MKTVGFIGYGHLGRMLVNEFLSAGVLRPEQIWVSNRTRSKMDVLREQWKGITLTKNNADVARSSDTLFACVKPLDVLPVLGEISKELSENTYLVSAAACVTLADIESCFSGQVSKVIASVTSEVREGISLVCHNKKVAEGKAHELEHLLGSIGKVMRIEEENFEVAADLTSCGPGLIAAIFQNFIDAG